MSEDFKYILLLACLLVVPKVLLRYRIPSGLTAIALGVITTLGLGWFQESQTITILSTLGITSLFLFAGLEVDYFELKKDALVLVKNVVQALILLTIIAFLSVKILHLSTRASIVLSLGLMTPSTGFILNSINSFEFSDAQKHWIRSKAISLEIVALIVLFFAVQSESFQTLAISLSGLIAMVAILPFLFRWFLKLVAPFAPDSEVTFLILLALLCGVLTRQLGTYYLIGAFIVGVVAAQFRHFIWTQNSEKMLYSVGFFAALFIPFYFFKAGISLGASSLAWKGLLYGLAFSAIFIPLRYFSVLLFIRIFLKPFWADRKEISLSLLPTLIFGLVIASILRDRFLVGDDIITGLVIYTVVNSIVPSIFLEKAPPQEYDTSVIRQSSIGRLEAPFDP